MKKLLLLILLIIPFLTQAQIEYNLEDNVTGSYATSKTGDQKGLVLNGTNHINRGNTYMDINPYYSLVYSGTQQIDNELLTREDIGITKKSLSFFIVHQYNSSLIRSISSDNWIGVGMGKSYTVKAVKFSVSDCMETEYKRYNGTETQTTVRNSFRVKVKVIYKGLQLACEYYYQPNVNDISDVNIFGTTSLLLFENKPVSFIIQNVYNFVSANSVHVIQGTTFGLNLKLCKKAK